MTKEFEESTDPIESLTSNMFRQISYSKIDALTVFIPKGQKPSPEIQKFLDEAGPQKWFPKDGGYLIKIPNFFESYDENLFKLEKDAWDHEHCDKCGAVINSGDLCWVAEQEDNSYLFCETCYQKL